MTALTADRNTPRRVNEVFEAPVAAAVKIFAGALVALDASGDAIPGAVSTTITGFGRAEETVDNTAGAAGDDSIFRSFFPQLILRDKPGPRPRHAVFARHGCECCRRRHDHRRQCHGVELVTDRPAEPAVADSAYSRQPVAATA